MHMNGNIIFILLDVSPSLVVWYCNWENTYEIYLKKLVTLQNKAIKLIGGANRRDNASPYYKKVLILKPNEIYNYEVAKLMYLSTRNQLPNTIKS